MKEKRKLGSGGGGGGVWQRETYLGGRATGSDGEGVVAIVSVILRSSLTLW